MGRRIRVLGSFLAVAGIASLSSAQTSAGHCLSFDDVDDFVHVPRSDSLEPLEITIEMWARLDHAQDWNSRLLRKCGHWTDGYYLAADSDNDQRMQLMVSKAPPLLQVKDVQPHTAYIGAWHHFIGVYAVDHAQFWVDGLMVTSVQHGFGTMSHLPLTDLFIGSGNPDLPWESFGGRIDEVRVWNYPRTPSEIAASWNRAAVGNEPGLVARWSFDEGAGQVAHDASPFGNDGVLGATMNAEPDDPTWLVSDAPIQPAGCTVWNLALDFRTAPDQANPNPDACGTPDVWHFLGSAAGGSPHDPTGYWLLPEFIVDMFGYVGVEQWQGYDSSGGVKNKLPAVGVNATGVHQSLGGIEWPAGVLRVHPSSSESVVVGWRSPLTGTVAVSGSLRDLHAGCTDGVYWSVDRYDGTTSGTLAWSYLPDGGVQAFASGTGGSSLEAIPVAVGDWLFFVVEPGADNACDSTGLDIVIRPAGPCGGATSYCTSTPNSSGEAATIAVTGSLSVSTIDTYLAADGCPPNRPGLFFYGAQPAQFPFANGYLCVSPFAPGLFRVPPAVTINPQGHAGVPLIYSQLPPAGAILAGSTWHFQFWFRDLAAGGAGSNLSDAVRVTFCP